MTHVKALCAKLQKIAYEELDEVPSRVPEDLLALKAWIQQQTYLKACTEDQFLVQFLRCCKHDVPEAKRRVENFYAFKAKFPPTMATESLKFREIHNLGCMVLLPTPLNDCGPRLAVFRFNYSAEEYGMEQIVEVCNALFEMCIFSDPYVCVSGLAIIFDMASLTPGHVHQYNDNMVKQLSAYYEKSLPLRLVGMYFFNVTPVCEQFFEMFFKHFSIGIRERVFIAGRNMNNLTDHIPLKYLPEDYAGNNGCLEKLVEAHGKVWNEFEEYFRQNAKYYFKQDLRPDGPIDFDGLFSSENFEQSKIKIYNRSR